MHPNHVPHSPVIGSVEYRQYWRQGIWTTVLVIFHAQQAKHAQPEALSSSACTMQHFTWQVDITGAAHVIRAWHDMLDAPEPVIPCNQP